MGFNEKTLVDAFQPVDSAGFCGRIHARYGECVGHLRAPGPHRTTGRSRGLWRYIQLGHCHRPVLWDNGGDRLGSRLGSRLVRISPSGFLADSVTGHKLAADKEVVYDGKYYLPAIPSPRPMTIQKWIASSSGGCVESTGRVGR
jgi:hypothetical protein